MLHPHTSLDLCLPLICVYPWTVSTLDLRFTLALLFYCRRMAELVVVSMFGLIVNLISCCYNTPHSPWSAGSRDNSHMPWSAACYHTLHTPWSDVLLQENGRAGSGLHVWSHSHRAVRLAGHRQQLWSLQWAAVPSSLWEAVEAVSAHALGLAGCLLHLVPPAAQHHGRVHWLWWQGVLPGEILFLSP